MTIPPRAANLRELAQAAGLPAEEIESAETDGTLGLLLIDRLVTEPGTLTQAEVIAQSGLGERAVRFWRALGFPEPDPDDRIFGSADVEMLQLIDTAIRLELLDEQTALQMARVIGSSIERIAQTQVDAIEARVDAEDPAADGELAVQRAQFLLPTVPRILDYVWRRHLQAAARRRMVRDTMAADGHRALAVGFADLVGFTALSQQLHEQELASVVDRFETTAYDLVTGHGGRVVKMIGDEVMFEVANAVVGVELGLRLAEAYHGDESVSDVRVGVAWGPVLAREGDLFGPTVNLASRMVSIAYPGSVVVSSDVREACGEDPRFAWKSLRTRYLKHIGRVQLYAARWADDATEGFAERARRRRGACATRSPSASSDGQAIRPDRPAAMIRCGLQIPNFTYPDVAPDQLFERVADVAVAAEAAGWDTVMVMDHFYQLPLLGPPEHEMFEAYTLLGALAARTKKVNLGTLVTGVTYRHPAILAKIVTTLDVISSGRAFLGIGAAWYDVEHEGLGVPFPPVKERFERLEDALHICRAMFRGERPTIEGTHHSVKGAINSPAPIRPGGPPIMIGGQGEKKTLRMMAQYADMANFTAGYDELPRKLEVLAGHCADVGRDIDTINKTPLLSLFLGSTHEEGVAKIDTRLAPMGMRWDDLDDAMRAQFASRFVIGDPDEVGDRIGQVLALGLDGVCFNMIADGHDVDAVSFAGDVVTKAVAAAGR